MTPRKTGYWILRAGLLLSLSWILPVWGQQGEIAVESKVDKSKITIGDLVKYSVVVTRDEKLKVQMPGPAANLGAFEIRDYEIYDPEKVNGKVVEKFDYVISTFDTGEYEIPPLVIRYTAPGDTLAKELRTEKIKILVESLKPSAAGDIKDIKPPLEILRDYRRLIYPSIGGLAVVLFGILIFYFFRRRKMGTGLLPRKMKPPRPPHEVALEELDELIASTRLAERKVKEFYIRLSEIIRRYVEGRFFIIAMEMTTEQLLSQMRETDVDPIHVELLRELLESCDLVKFAKYIPTEEENQKTIAQAYDFVNHTKLVVVEPEAEEVGTAEGISQHQKEGKGELERKSLELDATETAVEAK